MVRIIREITGLKLVNYGAEDEWEIPEEHVEVVLGMINSLGECPENLGSTAEEMWVEANGAVTDSVAELIGVTGEYGGLMLEFKSEVTFEV